MADDKNTVGMQKKIFAVDKNCAVFMPKDTFDTYKEMKLGEGSVVVVYPNRLAGKNLSESLKQMCDMLKIQDKKDNKSIRLRFWQK